MRSIDVGELSPWLEALWESRGSDLLLVPGSAPRLRVNGKLAAIDGAPVLDGEHIDEIVQGILGPEQKLLFELHLDVDFSFTWLDRARLRASAFTQRGDHLARPAHDSFRHPVVRRVGTASRRRVAVPPAPRPRPRDRTDRVRKVDDPGLHHRSHQPDPCRSTC